MAARRHEIALLGSRVPSLDAALDAQQAARGLRAPWRAGVPLAWVVAGAVRLEDRCPWPVGTEVLATADAGGPRRVELRTLLGAPASYAALWEACDRLTRDPRLAARALRVAGIAEEEGGAVRVALEG